MGRLESRVTILETEGRFKTNYPPLSVPSSSTPAENHGSSDYDGPACSLGSAPNGVVDKPEIDALHSSQMLQHHQRLSSGSSSSSSRKDSSDLLPPFEHNGVSPPKDLLNMSDASPPSGGDGTSDEPRERPLFIELFQRNEDCTPKVRHNRII